MATKQKVLTGTAALLLLGLPVYQQTRIHSLEDELAAQIDSLQTVAKSPRVAAPVAVTAPSGQRQRAGTAISSEPDTTSAAMTSGARRTSRSGPDGQGNREVSGRAVIPADNVRGEVTGADFNTASLTNLGILSNARPDGPPKTASGGIHWDHAQATGAPDTPEAGDRPTAWAPRNPQSGEQWLQLGFARAVPVKEINIHESHSSGAISKVTAYMPDGTEKTIWTGNAAPGTANEILETAIPVPRGVTSSQIKVYVDTNRVGSWPEIDAVELVGTDGSRQWASQSSASSSYSEVYGGHGAQSTPPDLTATSGSRVPR